MAPTAAAFWNPLCSMDEVFKVVFAKDPRRLQGGVAPDGTVSQAWGLQPRWVPSEGSIPREGKDAAFTSCSVEVVSSALGAVSCYAEDPLKTRSNTVSGPQTPRLCVFHAGSCSGPCRVSPLYSPSVRIPAQSALPFTSEVLLLCHRTLQRKDCAVKPSEQGPQTVGGKGGVHGRSLVLGAPKPRRSPLLSLNHQGLGARRSSECRSRQQWLTETGSCTPRSSPYAFYLCKIFARRVNPGMGVRTSVPDVETRPLPCVPPHGRGGGPRSLREEGAGPRESSLWQERDARTCTPPSSTGEAALTSDSLWQEVEARESRPGGRRWTDVHALSTVHGRNVARILSRRRTGR
ncbi:hypothetical protein CB1_000218005 [Camelus ferus]|nr:hypothetical protein CB1_000218005 [Camelus ferus]